MIFYSKVANMFRCNWKLVMMKCTGVVFSHFCNCGVLTSYSLVSQKWTKMVHLVCLLQFKCCFISKTTIIIDFLHHCSLLQTIRVVNCLISASNWARDTNFYFFKERARLIPAKINLEINLAIALIVVNCKLHRNKIMYQLTLGRDQLGFNINYVENKRQMYI